MTQSPSQKEELPGAASGTHMQELTGIPCHLPLLSAVGPERNLTQSHWASAKSLPSEVLPSCFCIQPANHLLPQLPLFPQDSLCRLMEQQARRGTSTDLLQLEHSCRPRPRKGCSQIFTLPLLWSGFTSALCPSGLSGLRGSSTIHF